MHCAATRLGLICERLLQYLIVLGGKVPWERLLMTQVIGMTKKRTLNRLKSLKMFNNATPAKGLL